MSKFPSNIYDQRKLYNDILLEGKPTNSSHDNKSKIKKPLDIKQTASHLNNSSVNTSSNLQTKSNLNLSSNIKTITHNQTDPKAKEIPDLKTEENKHNTTPDKSKTDLKPEKLKVQRLRLDEKTLFYSENGIKKFYEVISQSNFKENRSEMHNLNKLIQIYKNWHFMLYPKYNIDFFTSKLIDLGKKPAGRAYMSRLRKIYKGEESWDVIYNQQDEILNINGKSKNTQQDTNGASPSTNKFFREDMNNPNKLFSYDNISLNSLDKNKAPGFNKITTKLNNVSLTNSANKKKMDDSNVEEIQDLVFQNVEVDRQENQMMFEVNENDYMNFDDIHNDDDNKSVSRADSFAYKNEKRNFIKAFGEKSLDRIEEFDIISSKKMKLN